MCEYCDSDCEYEEVYEEPEYREHWDVEDVLAKIPNSLRETLVQNASTHNIELSVSLLEDLFRTNEFFEMMQKAQVESKEKLSQDVEEPSLHEEGLENIEYMVVPMVEEIHTMTIDHDKKNGSDDESLDEEMSPMDVMMNDLTTEDKSPEKEASHTSTIILHPSIQRHPSISFIKWQNNRVCNLFFFPIPLKICFSNDMLGFVSVFGQKQHKIILKICGVEKFTSEGEWHDTLVSFSTEEDISDHNLMALPTSFNNSWFEDETEKDICYGG
ncbi:PREDICTED: uncharacterized protein LOC109116035 isoform X2 [Tarenaya hassleriana]|uniref:uncharacterized protein LOC109116035 isoform X2 n=1 Tax=Tarenaya hassleriana TaxID=28532 RepID=UPI0008FCFAC8|nr:PREDICTED: uncharacterized protein LOC109116035 isoform X2 [Tarenaya hassleriana]